MAINLHDYYEYINEESIEQMLICKICNKPLIEPVTTSCLHIFCRQCIENSFDTNTSRCSSCNESLSKTDLIRLTDQSLLETLDRIPVKCKLCDETNIKRVDVDDHIMNMCAKAIVACGIHENSCPWIGLREEFQIHLAENSSEVLPSNAEIDENSGESCKQNCASVESSGRFLTALTVNLQERQFKKQDIAIAVKALLINKRSKYLDLYNKGISSVGASIIASVLHDDKLLETLGLRNNLICDSGAQHIAHALRTNLHLQRLDLNNNSITDTGVRLLAEMLKINKTLIKLTLSYNRITNEGMNIFADLLVNYNSTLQWLSLAGNTAINDSCFPSIINTIRHNQSLTTLVLEDCGLSRWKKKAIYIFQALHHKSNLNLLL